MPDHRRPPFTVSCCDLLGDRSSCLRKLAAAAEGSTAVLQAVGLARTSGNTAHNCMDVALGRLPVKVAQI